MGPTFFSSKLNRGLVAAVLVVLMLTLASYAFLNIQMAKTIYPMPANISVTGEGKVRAVPTVGQFSFSVLASGATATEAQAQSAEKNNAVLVYLKEQGVEEKDIKTENYALNPKYRYEEKPCAFGTYCPPGEPIPDGFEVSQTVMVKIRDTAQSGTLIAGVGEKGATNVSGLTFVVDDLTAIRAEARTKAIADAKLKADALAKELGVEIVRLTGYYENEGGSPMPYAAKTMDMAEGAFGGVPKVPVGESDTVVSVSVTYEIK